MKIIEASNTRAIERLVSPAQRGDRDFERRVLSIVDAVRTPVGKKGGGLASAHPADLGAHAISGLVDRTGIDPAAVELRGRAMSKPVVAPGGLARVFQAAGLADVDERPLLIRMEHPDFADYWGPFLRGEGPIGGYVVGLADAARARLEQHVRAAYLAGAPDGPRSFAAVAWSCRGVVPRS